MSKYFNIENASMVHIELTTVCQASCPQCARENPALYNHSNESSLGLQDIIEKIPPWVVTNLDKVLFCGNFGDPCASGFIIPIIKYFRRHNPDIVIGVNTNGGLRNAVFWKELASVTSNERDYVVFSIDGLSDTNEIYRRHVSWERVMSNVKTYIDAGGNAHWDMLVYDHNEHQVDEAQELAQTMGFKWFRAKISKRFSTRPIKFLNPPKGMAAPEPIESNTVKCHALNENSVYLAANGEFLPCCWMGDYIFTRDPEIDHAVKTDTVLDRINNSNPLPICKQTCSVADNQTNFTQQWRIDKEL